MLVIAPPSQLPEQLIAGWGANPGKRNLTFNLPAQLLAPHPWALVGGRRES